MDRADIDPQTGKEILEYLSLEEEDLYSILGAYSAPPGTVFAPSGQIKAGRRYFSSIRDHLHQKICGEWNLCAKIADPRWDDGVQLAAALGDVVSTVAVGVPPLTIASLIVKIGARSFCRCSDT
jgi:hypothetical protein